MKDWLNTVNYVFDFGKLFHTPYIMNDPVHDNLDS